MQGFIQVYTGTGKGKTTAAIGLLCRAIGGGLRACFIQFLKTGDSSEISLLRDKFPKLALYHFGSGRFVVGNPHDEDIALAREGFVVFANAVASGNYDLVVADEINVVVELGLVDTDDLLRVLRGKPKGVEIVLTGRDAHSSVIDAADLVTEMRKIKHYMDDGIEARVGIEK